MGISWDFIIGAVFQNIYYFYGNYNSYATNYHRVIILSSNSLQLYPIYLSRIKIGPNLGLCQSLVRQHKKQKSCCMDVHSCSIQQGLMMCNRENHMNTRGKSWENHRKTIPNGVPKKIIFCVSKPIGNSTSEIPINGSDLNPPQFLPQIVGCIIR